MESEIVLTMMHCFLPQVYQNKNFNHGSSVDVTVNKLESRPEAKQDSHFVPDYLYKQLIDKYEQLGQQMNFKYDQLIHEFHSHFEILSSHISNIGDAQANSLKLYFMHEIDLLKQDLKRLIVEQNMRPETNLKQPVVSTQQMGAVHSQDLSTQQAAISQPGSSSSQCKDQKNMNKPQFNFLQQSTEEFQLQQGELAQLNGGHHLAGDKGVIHAPQKGPLKSQNTFADILRNEPAKSKANAAGMPASAKIPATGYAGAKGGTSTDILQDLSYTAAAVNKKSVAATGLFADTIASQMKNKQSSQAGSVESSTNSVKSDPGETKSGKKKGKSSILSTSSAKKSKYEFTIDVHFVALEMPFMSPYIYSSGKPCKARVVFIVKKQSFLLTVNVLVSKGDFDDSHRWPLTLKGKGYVFHPGSRRFTPLWDLESVVCEKPSEEGRMFPTVVCLMTSKRNHKDVTLKELMIRYEVGDQNLTFLWDLKATEQKES